MQSGCGAAKRVFRLCVLHIYLDYRERDEPPPRKSRLYFMNIFH